MNENKEKNFISAVVYINNCENEVETFLKNLYNELSSRFLNFEIICVNDGSHDRSVEKIKAQGSLLNSCVISVVNLSYYQGLEAAMDAGIDLAIGDFVFEFDSVFVDYPFEMISELYFKSLEGFDIVSARNKKSKTTSKIFYNLFNSNSNTQYNLSSESFRVLSRRALNRVRSMSSTRPYRKAQYYSCGLKAAIIEYNAVSAIKNIGQPKKVRRELALNSLILFTNVAYKISVGFALAMMLVLIITTVYVVAVYLAGAPVAGYTTTMLLISGCFFGVFAVLTIIIKYLSLLVDLVFKKQKYMIESVEKITIL